MEKGSANTIHSSQRRCLKGRKEGEGEGEDQRNRAVSPVWVSAEAKLPTFLVEQSPPRTHATVTANEAEKNSRKRCTSKLWQRRCIPHALIAASLLALTA